MSDERDVIVDALVDTHEAMQPRKGYTYMNNGETQQEARMLIDNLKSSPTTSTLGRVRYVNTTLIVYSDCGQGCDRETYISLNHEPYVDVRWNADRTIADVTITTASGSCYVRLTPRGLRELKAFVAGGARERSEARFRGGRPSEAKKVLQLPRVSAIGE